MSASHDWGCTLCVEHPGKCAICAWGLACDGCILCEGTGCCPECIPPQED